MKLTAQEKIKIILGRRGMTLTQLADQTSQSRANLSNKMTRDNFSEKELQEIAQALGCSFEAEFIMLDTKERI